MPRPAVIHCTAPSPYDILVPIESRCTRPARSGSTYVTVSKPRCLHAKGGDVVGEVVNGHTAEKWVTLMS